MEDSNEIEKIFNSYVSKVKALKNINDSDKLFLYAHYKQVLNGNNINSKPSIFNRIEMAKWKAWNDVKDVSKNDAMKNYIKKVIFLEKKNDL